MNKRAGNRRHVSVTTVSDQNHTDVEDLPISSNDHVSNKLDALVKAVTDLSRRVQATEEHLKVGAASP